MCPDNTAASHPEGERLQKVLAAAGVASSRASEQLILAGSVSVNGRTVRELGTRVHPDHDLIRVDGTPIQTDQTKVYYMLNKPVGVVSSMHDERGRPDLSAWADQSGVRVFNVGRLDEATRGLLILTNDGELAHRLAHPSFEVRKVYLARVRGHVSDREMHQLERGIDLPDGPVQADSARVIDSTASESLVEIRLHSGRNRIVRRMLAAIGHPVTDLLRKQFGPLHLGTLPASQMRALTNMELGALLALSLPEQRSTQKPRTQR